MIMKFGPVVVMFIWKSSFFLGIRSGNFSVIDPRDGKKIKESKGFFLGFGWVEAYYGIVKENIS
jgi:hypothetical protein